MNIDEFHPKSMMVTKETYVSKPMFPVIEAHNHLGAPIRATYDQLPAEELLTRLDEIDVRLYVDLDGGWGEKLLQKHLDKFKARAPERFMMFGGVDWNAWPVQGEHFGEWAADRLRKQVAWGAQGLKVWKPFGLSVKDQHGRLVGVDDSRLDPIWETAGELQIPIMIHVADPVAFFEPLDAENERWAELVAHPDWQFPSPPYPPFITIVEGMANLVRRFPQTTWIGAHVGCYVENLNWVAKLLDECPNFYVDISARINELGRQPYSSRRFFINYQDRILFGTDWGIDSEMFRNFYRFLETDDEYFYCYLKEEPGMGWNRIYGLYLPSEVLQRIYYQNAEFVLKVKL
jgi:predicted TIM-barrel fold metal-dependent hydrolase